MANEIQNYLNYIRSMGITAWIPDSPGYGPKMSVTEQCRSRILCLNYDGTEIYVQCVNNHVTTCDGKGSSCSAKNRDVRTAPKSVWLPNNINRFDNSTEDAGNSTQEAGDGPPEYLANALCEPSSKRFVVGLQQCTAGSNGLQQTLKNTPPGRLERAAVGKTLETDNRPLPSHAPEAPQCRRVVHEKLTREVRVAKRYVSSLPNVQRDFGGRTVEKTAAVNVPRGNRGGDQPAVVKSAATAAEVARPVRGFVRRLIERFDVDRGADRCGDDRSPEEPLKQSRFIRYALAGEKNLSALQRV